MKQGRGQLTARIEKLSKKLLGYAIDTIELRLMVYTQYVMVNEQRFIERNLRPEEHEIIQKWEDAGYANNEGVHLTITKKFWDILCEILYLGYVDTDKGAL